MIKHSIIIEMKKTTLVLKETKGAKNKIDSIINNPSSKSTNFGTNKMLKLVKNIVVQNMHPNKA